MTQRPELFRRVVCAVPLLDMVRYHLFGSGKTWIPEYGSADDPEQFEALYAYSPYHHARRGPARYPAVAASTRPTATTASIRCTRASSPPRSRRARPRDAPVLLRIERNAGHGGADMVKQQVERVADQLAFLESQLR